jgi:hypothetical protein
MGDTAKVHQVYFKSGLAVWLLKYGALAGFFLCFALLMLIDIFNSNNLILLNLTILIFLGMLLFILQMCYSWYLPLELIIYKDKLCSVGAWKVKHTMRFSDIKFIKCNNSELLVQSRTFFFNKIWITKVQDPEQKSRKLLMSTLKDQKIDVESLFVN